MQLLVKDREFYKKLTAFALPICAQQLITMGVNMADNIMLGQLGEVQMSGATLANNFISLFQIMCMGLGMGATVMVSRFFGMKDRENMKRSVNIMLRLEVLTATLFCIATALMPGPIMSLFSGEADVIAIGTGYLLISIPCYYLNGLSVTTSLVLRSVGKANVPLYSSIASFFLNIFCNWVFIFGHLGAPRMEANGAALGTLIARVVEFLITVGYLLFRDAHIGLRPRDLTMSVRSLIPEYFRISIPVLVSDTLLGLGNTMTAVISGRIGSAFVSANAITTVTMMLATVISQGLSQASCAITGITLGEGETEKAQRQGVTMGFLGFLVGCFGCVLIQLLADPIISLYKIEPDTKLLARELMRAVGFVVMFQTTNSILTKGVLRGGGDTKFLMVMDVLFLWVASLPLGALAGLYWHLPGFWIYIFLKIDQFIKAVICVYRLKSRKWIKVIRG
ncbi:MAG: MATE family efflux transporter [Lachnospiraceae bacterium]|nr:MATE family efflux transporter [Lachnospiraceae bacterium]